MSLYDDEDLDSSASGWTPGGMKLLQTHVQLKKSNHVAGLAAKGKNKQRIAPVVDLKSKDSGFALPKSVPGFAAKNSSNKGGSLAASVTLLYSDLATPIVDEYDPVKPNDYEKAAKALRMREDEKRSVEEKTRGTKDKDKDKDKDKEKEKDRWSEKARKSRSSEKDRDRDRDRDRSRSERDRDRDRRRRDESPPMGKMPEGFCKVRGESDDEDDDRSKGKDKGRRSGSGAMIAPPPSLQESKEAGGTGLAVAAKIMAKYGYREGQGLGKHEHGMSTALQVEKTSKRGGRIIHEKMLMPPPPPPAAPGAPSTSGSQSLSFLMPPPPPPGGSSGGAGAGGPAAGGSGPIPAGPHAEDKKEDETSITEMMRNPSKVVLLKNMVGPGEVDDFLEPEVKDECSTKYGEVIKVIIFEIPTQIPEDAVRIFVEFKRMEAAIKAVVDLNGRFFGGRLVRAGFYDQGRFGALQLGD